MTDAPTIEGRQTTTRRKLGTLLTVPLAVLVVAVLLPFTAFVVASWLLGWQLQPVLSASMSPTYPVGSLLVVGQIDAGDVQPGMAIAFDDPGQPGRLVTHRVVRVQSENGLFLVTRGDANASDDAFPVPARSVRGRVLWNVPVLGYAVDFLRWPRGFIILVVIPVAALVAAEVLAWRRRRPGAAAAQSA